MAVYAWTNADGLQVNNPDRIKNPATFVNVPRGISTLSAVKQIELDIDLTRIPTTTVSYTSDLNNDGTLDGFNTGDTYLPAYASVLRVTLVTQVAATGGTSFIIGTYGLTGTAIDDDALVTVTEGVIANINTIGKRVYGNGALVATTAGTASVGSVDAYIGVTATGTYTAGKVRAIIEYIDPLADS